MIGSVTGAEVERLNLPPIFMRNVTMRGVAVGSRELFEEMIKAIAHHRIAPVMNKTYRGLASFSDSLEALSKGEHFGKIGLLFD